jgi:hypothetical protein
VFIFVKIQSKNEKVSRGESENENARFFKHAERGQIKNLEPAFNVVALTTNLGSKQYHRVLFFSNKKLILRKTLAKLILSLLWIRLSFNADPDPAF